MEQGQSHLVVTGDFNRHDPSWGGDKIHRGRLGEAEPILQMMGRLGLDSLLPRGTITWQNGRHESTVDLMLASPDLAKDFFHCRPHPSSHGSDHMAIDTAFDLAVPERVSQPRPLFNRAQAPSKCCSGCSPSPHPCSVPVLGPYHNWIPHYISRRPLLQCLPSNWFKYYEVESGPDEEVSLLSSSLSAQQKCEGW
jgi:Endonuclease-reverse transcriptase